MNKLFKRTTIIILIILMMFNFIFPRVTFADTTTAEDPLKGNVISGPLDGILGFLLYPLKLGFIIPSILIYLCSAAIAGDTNVSMYSVFFDKIEITKINLFEGTSDSAVGSIRKSVFEFYKAFRNFAIVFSFATLVYIALRMALSNIAEEKAKYKAWIVNWLVGFGLIFAMSYIIVFVLNANTLLVRILDNAANSSYSGMGDIMGRLVSEAFNIPLTTSFTAMFMHLGLSIMTLIFIIIYIKRMITIAFLVVISPLITVTYSIDKIGNNKSEILNTWLREFLYNVLIQPFHCIIFAVFIGTAMKLLTESGSLNFGAMIYALILTFSIFSAQKLVREIFGFGQSSSLTEKVAIVALAQRTVSNVRSIVAIKGARNDAKAAKAEKKLKGVKNYAMPGGQEVTGAELARLRSSYQQTANYENKVQKAAKKGKTPPKRPSNKSMPRKRRLKNAPAPIRKVGRMYRDYMGAMTGVNRFRRMRINRKKQRQAPYKMKDKDYAIAVAQSYREAVNPNMSNKDLANEYARISAADPSTLNPKEVEYMVMMQAMQAQFNLKDGDISDAILNGTGHKRRWS